MQSLTESPYRNEKVATVTFKQTPAVLLDDMSQRKDEWQIEATECSETRSSALNDGANVSGNMNRSVQLVIDTHFRGFTPLHGFRENYDYKIE